MAQEVELERMVVKLLLSAEQYQAQLQQQATATKSFADEIQGRLAGAVTALGAGTLLREGLANWQEAEDIGIRLSAVLQANGRDVEATAERYDQFAKQLEKTTTLEDDQVLSLLALAESYDLTNEKAERAIQDAHAIAAINGGVAESYLRIAAAMQEGDLEKAMHMARMIPQLRGVKDEAEFVAKFMKLTAAGMIAAEKAAESSSGQMKTLKRDFGNLLEELGGFVAKALNPVVSGLKAMVEWFRSLPEPAKETATAILGLTAAAGALQATVGLGNPLSWLALAGGSAIYLTAQIVGASEAVQSMNRRLKESAEQTEFVRQQFAQLPQQVKGKMEDLPGADRKEFLAKEVQNAEAMVEIYRRAKERIKADMQEAFETVPGEPLENMSRALAELGPRAKVYTDELKNVTAQEDAAKTALMAIRKEFEKIAGGRMSEQVAKDLKKLNEELEKAARQKGLSDLEKKLDDLAQKGAQGPGVAAAEQVTRFMQDAEKFAESQKAAKQAADELTKSAVDMGAELESRLATWGMSAEHARIFKMEMEELSDGLVDYLTNLANMADVQKEWDKQAEKGKSLTERIIGKDPLANFQKEMGELQRLFDEGHVTEEIYRMGIKQLEEEFNKAGKTADKMGGKFDAALSNSADARQRIQQFYDAMDRRNTKRPTADAGRFDQAARGGAEAGQREEKQVNKLEDIRKLMQQQVNRPVLVVEGANL